MAEGQEPWAHRVELLANLESLDHQYQSLTQLWQRLSASDNPIERDRAADMEAALQQIREALVQL